METRIKDLRTDRELTQSEVAQSIGISQRKYSYLETGKQQWTAGGVLSDKCGLFTEIDK